MPFCRFCIFGGIAGWHDGQDVVVFHFREEVVEFFRIEVADADGAEAVVSSGEPVGCYSEAGVYVAVVFVVEAANPGFVGVVADYDVERRIVVVECCFFDFVAVYFIGNYPGVQRLFVVRCRG